MLLRSPRTLISTSLPHCWVQINQAGTGWARTDPRSARGASLATSLSHGSLGPAKYSAKGEAGALRPPPTPLERAALLPAASNFIPTSVLSAPGVGPEIEERA